MGVVVCRCCVLCAVVCDGWCVMVLVRVCGCCVRRLVCVGVGVCVCVVVVLCVRVVVCVYV